MGILKRASILAVTLIIPAVLYAQFNNNTTSPYSRFSLGDLHSGTLGRSAAMGGAILGSRNNLQVNLNNPASYTSVDSLSFIFDFGLDADFANYKTDISSLSTNDINFKYFAFSFPVTHWLGVGIGLTPYSDSGYDIQITQNNDTFGQIWHRYHGEGSLSKAIFGIGIKPVKYISVGANLYYLFGKLTRNADVVFLEALDFYNDQKYDQIRIRNFGVSYGLQATLPITPKKKVTLGLTLDDKPEFTAFHTNVTRKILSNSSATTIDTVSIINAERGIVTMPLGLGTGISYTTKDHLEINADYIHQAWSKASLPWDLGQNVTDLDRFALGVEFIPDKFSIRSYFDKVAYRAGVNFEKYYLIIDGHQLNNIGISFGVGLPIYRSLSEFNISAEFGKQGTTDFNLVRQYYARLTFSISLYENWFMKRKFD